MLFSNSYSYEYETSTNIDLICPVCLDPFHLPICDVRCRHTFCFRCLHIWIKQNQTCPVCRQPFTELTLLSNKSLLAELDYLPVRCIKCNQTNIRRGAFDDHVTHKCTKRLINDDDKRNKKLRVEKHIYFDYLLRRINESVEIHRSHHQLDYDRNDLYYFPFWTTTVSYVRLIIYVIALLPIAILLNITDAIFYILSYIAVRLIRLNELRI